MDRFIPSRKINEEAFNLQTLYDALLYKYKLDNQIKSTTKPSLPIKAFDALGISNNISSHSMDWSGNTIAIALDNSIYFIDTITYDLAYFGEIEVKDSVDSLCWLNNGTTLCINTMDRYTHIRDIETKAIVLEYSTTNSINVMANRNYLLCSDRLGDVMMIDKGLRNPLVMEITSKDGISNDIKWRDDYTFVTASASGILKLWDIRKKSLVKEFERSNHIQSMAWSPFDKNVMVTAGFDSKLKSWNITKKEPITVKQLSEPIIGVHWCQGTDKLVATFKESTMGRALRFQIFNNDLRSITELYVDQPDVHVNSVVQSPNGNDLLIGINNEHVEIWNMFETKKETKYTDDNPFIEKYEIR